MRYKLDGYRAIAGRSGNSILFRSRRDNEFTSKFPSIAKAFRILPDETLVDGEVAALDEQGRPSFNLLQNYQSALGALVYFAFDLLMFKGESLLNKPLDERKAILEQQIVPKLQEPLRYMEPIEGRMEDIIRTVKEHGLEGLVAKHPDSMYEPGRRSGAWQKMRVDKTHSFVIGGYTIGGSTFDALVFGYNDKGKLVYASRTRNGFTPVSRADLLRRMKALEVKECPFANLPQAKEGRWGVGLGCEDEGLCMAETAARRRFSIYGMNRRRAFAPKQFSCAQIRRRRMLRRTLRARMRCILWSPCAGLGLRRDPAMDHGHRVRRLDSQNDSAKSGDMASVSCQLPGGPAGRLGNFQQARSHHL